MRATLHAALVTLGMVPLLLAWACLYLGGWIMVQADRLMPNARVGNCWSHALPLWWKDRQHTYIAVRDVRRARLIWGWGSVAHVLFIGRLGGGAELSQTEPVDRYEGDNLLARKLRFPFRIRTEDIPKS